MVRVAISGSFHALSGINLAHTISAQCYAFGLVLLGWSAANLLKLEVPFNPLSKRISIRIAFRSVFIKSWLLLTTN
jgi:hypothetical protein